MIARIFSAVGLLALFASSVALAQESPKADTSVTGHEAGPAYGYDPGMMTGDGWGSGRLGSCGSSGYGIYSDSRLASLKRELRITDGQEKVWNDYANALQATSEVMAGIHRQMIGAPAQSAHSSMTVVDLDIDATQSKLPSVEALKPATIALYKSLSEEQRKTADARLPAAGCI